jgi:hypothetical protein
MKVQPVRDGDFEVRVVDISRQGNFIKQAKSLRRTGCDFMAAYFCPKQSE